MPNIIDGGVIGAEEGKLYDNGVIAGFARYLCFGLPPGGFESACIAMNYDLAMSRAANSLRPRPSQANQGWAGTADQNIVANMIEFVELNFPEEARGDWTKQIAWMHSEGFRRSPERRTMAKLSNYKWIDIAMVNSMGLRFNWITGEAR